MPALRPLCCLPTMLACLFAAALPTAAQQNGRTQAVRPRDHVIKLFDGESLEGLYTWLKDTKYEDPRKVFRVTDGMLHITGDGLGAVTTRQAYRDYHLVLEFRWGEKTWGNRKDRARDSGLLIHSTGADGGYGGTWMPSIEVQIIEGGCGDFILVAGNDEQGKPVPLSLTCRTGRDRDGEVVWKPDGTKETFNLKNRRRVNWFARDPDWKDVLGFRGKDDVESPAGRWTRMDVIADGGRIEVYVNGTKVNEALDCWPTYGRIQLQSELAEIFVRRWELWPIGQGPKPAPAKN